MKKRSAPGDLEPKVIKTGMLKRFHVTMAVNGFPDSPTRE
jgi:hypothetical protein